jgi:hypothetical protein
VELSQVTWWHAHLPHEEAENGLWSTSPRALPCGFARLFAG